MAFLAFFWLLKQLDATSMSYVALVIPIVAVFLGVSLGNEVLDPLAILGAGTTLTGIYVATSKRVSAWVRTVKGKAAVSTGSAPPNPSEPKR